eukprot:322799-Chlamydomonas_euryale.AAC.1
MSVGGASWRASSGTFSARRSCSARTQSTRRRRGSSRSSTLCWACRSASGCGTSPFTAQVGVRQSVALGCVLKGWRLGARSSVWVWYLAIYCAGGGA